MDNFVGRFEDPRLRARKNERNKNDDTFDCFRETNLKCRQCLTETAEMMDNHELIGQFDGEIVCETPNNLLNKFDGTLTWKGRK